MVDQRARPDAIDLPPRGWAFPGTRHSFRLTTGAPGRLDSRGGGAVRVWRGGGGRPFDRGDRTVDDALRGQRGRRGQWVRFRRVDYPAVFTWPVQPLGIVRWLPG